VSVKFQAATLSPRAVLNELGDLRRRVRAAYLGGDIHWGPCAAAFLSKVPDLNSSDPKNSMCALLCFFFV
jgi:hypothetical protein